MVQSAQYLLQEELDASGGELREHIGRLRILVVGVHDRNESRVGLLDHIQQFGDVGVIVHQSEEANFAFDVAHTQLIKEGLDDDPLFGGELDAHVCGTRRTTTNLGVELVILPITELHFDVVVLHEWFELVDGGVVLGQVDSLVHESIHAHINHLQFLLVFVHDDHVGVRHEQHGHQTQYLL